MEKGNELLLSVIVPVYNVERYLDRCLESIVGQTYSNLEIILVDDGSPDGCPAKCDEWSRRDSRIKVIHKENGGAGSSRNVALDAATGAYVAFVDSDDVLVPEMYERLMHEAVAKEIDCVYCGFRHQLPSLEFVDEIDMGREAYHGKDILDLSSRFIMDFSRKQLNFGIWHGVYRRKLIDFRFVSEREYMSEDLIFTLMFLRNCSSFSYIPEALYNYMYNARSLSNSYTEQTFKRVIATAMEIDSIYEGTRYCNAGNAYAFCQVYFLMRFPMMKSDMPLKRKYAIFRDVLLDKDYNQMLQHRESFDFRKGLKYKLIKSVYNLHRKKRVRLNFLAILLISLKKG